MVCSCQVRFSFSWVSVALLAAGLDLRDHWRVVLPLRPEWYDFQDIGSRWGRVLAFSAAGSVTRLLDEYSSSRTRVQIFTNRAPGQLFAIGIRPISTACSSRYETC